MSPRHDPSFMAHFAQCKVSAKQQVNIMIDAIYAKVLLDLELWLNKHENNDSVHGLGLNLNESTGEQMQFMLKNTQQIQENVNCPPSLPPSNFGHLLNVSIKSEIDSDCEENVTEHNNLPGESQFDHQNYLQNEVSLSNIIRTESITKQLDDEEDVEEIDDDSVAKYENSDTTQLDFLAALENNQTNPLIISNDISPSPTNPINTQPLIKQECLQNSSITSIQLNVNRNASLNDISIDEQFEGQNAQIQTDEFDVYDDLDHDDGENENLINNLNCASGVNNLPFLENNNHSIDDMFARDEDEVDIETNFDETQFDISVTNNTQMNNQNDKQNVINERSVSERNMEQSTPSTSGVRSSTRKPIQTKVFGDLVQSNGNHGKCGKRKSGRKNESVKKVKPKQILDEDEDTGSDDQEDHTNNAIGEEIATECTTNPIQANLAQSNRHLQCSHCPKSFNCNSALQQHLRVHTGERPFQCDHCAKKFIDKGTLTKHQLIHQNIKRFKCDQCGKQFTQKVNLESHLRIHSGQRPHQCRFCEKSFIELCARKRHEQAIHLQVKPYRCKQCGHTATQRTTIIRHIRMVHFGLPKTIKQQRALNIIDDRDPRELVEKV